MCRLIRLVILLLLSCSAAHGFASESPDNGNKSLAFVFDTTASMRVDYEQFKNNVQNTMEHVWERPEADVKHFVFVPFNDPDVGEVSETVSPKQSSHYMNNLLHKKIRIGGGGDCPEKSLTAVVKALEAVNHDSHVFLFTDASPKDSYAVNDVLDLVQRKRTRVIVINTGENCLSPDKSYERITSLGLGHVFDICKNDISNILNFIKISMLINCKVNLMYVNNPRSNTVPYPTKLSVDKSIKNLMITVSGLNSKLDVINSNGGENHGASENLTTDLDLKNVKIVSIKEPRAGEWTLNVTSESPYSIRACGISYAKNCVFGFATKEPKTMSQTIHRPLAGTKNYVLVDCPDAKHFSCCNILDLNGDVKNILLLKSEKNLLSCGPFKPKSNPFYVQICGTASDGDFFKRISTSVIPVKLGAPYVTSPEKMFAFVGGELLINCHVESSVPFTVTWSSENSNYPIKTSNFSQSSEFPLLMTNLTEIQFVRYTCSAQVGTLENGRATSTTTVIRDTNYKESRFKKNYEIIELFEGEDYLLECKNYGAPAVSQIDWLVNGSEITTDDEHILAINRDKRVIYDARLNDTNVYACRASNESGVTENHFNVTVKVYNGNSVANESFTGKLDSTVILPCRIPNSIQWFKDSKPIEDERGDVKRLKQIATGLRISYLRELDTALYECVNIANETYAVDLQVEFEPYFTEENDPKPLSVPRRSAEPVVFDCSARGIPKLKIKWKKHEKPLTRWHFENIEFSEDEQRLKIHPVDARDWTMYNGTYSCLIKNKLGNETRNFELNVI